jgi:hypothetical protein
VVTRTTLPRLTDRIPLGYAGLEVSPFCLGITEDPATVQAAFEAGINFFFVTADMHWPMYERTRLGLRQLLRDKPDARDRIVVAVVAYVTQREFLWMPFREVLGELPELKQLDVTVAGGSYRHDIGQRMSIFEQHRAQSFLGVRAIGASFHDRLAALAEIERGIFDLAFVRYNPVHPKARSELFERVGPRGADRRTLIYNFKSTIGYLEQEAYAKLAVPDDYWRPHITDYYRFALTEPAIDGILCSLPTPASVGELADALMRGPLDDDDRQYLLDLGQLALGNARL